jgi:hypothetical protein
VKMAFFHDDLKMVAPGPERRDVFKGIAVYHQVARL